MKVLAGLLVVLIVLGTVPPITGASAATPAPNSSGADMAAPRLDLVRSDAQATELEFSASAYTTRVVEADGYSYDLIEMPGLELLSDVGKPRVPVQALTLGIPPDADLAVEILDSEYEQLPGTYKLLPEYTLLADVPLQGPLPEAGADVPMPTVKGTVTVPDAGVYSSDAFYPGELVGLADPAFIRSQRVVGVQFYPIQFNPQTGEVRLYRHIRARLNLTYPHGLDASAWTAQAEPDAFETLLRSSLLNYSSARHWRLPRQSTAGSVPRSVPVPGYKIRVNQDGIYELTYTDLQNAGLPVGSLDPTTFQVFHQGEELAIYVAGEADGSFDPGDFVLFWGEGINTKYTNENVYWLTYGQAQGLRMQERDGAPSGTAPVPVSTQAQRHSEVDVGYWSLMPGNDDLDRWYWAYASGGQQIVQTATLGQVAAVSATATLKVAFIGYTSDAAANPDHHVRWYVNNQLAGEGWWDGVTYQVFETDFPQSYLIPGNNEVKFTVPGDTGASAELDLLDWFEISYQHAYQAVGDELRFFGDQAGDWEYHVSEFTDNNVEVWDVSVPTRTVLISNTVVVPGGVTYTLRFEDSVSPTVEYWAQTVGQRLSPLSIELDAPSDLYSLDNGADYIMISHADFFSSMVPLLQSREAQGFRGMLVDVQDVYDEFSFGITDPQAIHDFLDYAYHNWVQPAPSYVVLVGDGHFDPKNNLGYGMGEFILPYMAYVDPWIGETAADNWYVNVEGDDPLPEMLLGRLPVNTLDEATAVVTKIATYESAEPADWMSRALFVTDDPDEAGNFYQLSDDVIQNHLPAPYTYTRNYYLLTCSPATTCRAQNIADINAGQLFVNYIGHGSVQYWSAQQLFRYVDIATLANGTKMPIFLPMTCLEGSFHYPYPGTTAVGEGIVVAAGKGGIASWSPTGFGVTYGHDQLDRGFLDSVFADDQRLIGPATYAGKLRLYNAGYSLDQIQTYHLFGDPALRINALDPDLHLGKTVEPTGTVQPGDPITYTLTFSNTGAGTAHHVVLTDIVPPQLVNPTVVYSSPEVISQQAGIDFVWTITNLVSGTVGSVQFRAVVGPEPCPTVINNTAELYSPISQASASTLNDLWVPNADLQIGKTVQPTGQVRPGRALTYTLTFANNGPDTATGVVVTDLVPEALISPTVIYSSPEVISQQVGITFAWNVADLAPGAGGEIQFRATVSPTAPPGFLVVNEASIASGLSDCNPSNDVVSVTTGILVPDMVVEKVGPAAVSFGQPLTYTLTWGNMGEVFAPGVRLTDTLPPGIEYVSDSSGFTLTQPAPGILVWEVSPYLVPSGTMESFVLTGWVPLDPDLVGPLVNSVEINSTLPDPNPANNQDEWSTDLLWPDLAVDKSGPATAIVLSEISYTLAYSNTGDAPAQSVVLTDVLPAGVSYVADNSGFTPSEPVPGTYVWDIGDLPAGASGSFAVTVAVGDYADVGDELVNTVLIGALAPDSDPADNTADWMTAVLLPDLAVAKTGPAQAGANATLTYTLVYSNVGEGPALGVVLTEVLPAGVAYLSDDSGFTPGEPFPGTYVWEIGDLAAGAGGTFHVLAQVDSAVQPGDVLTNTVQIGADSPDAGPGNDQAQWAVTVVQTHRYIYLPIVLKNYQ
jgi:uncharacterized repeat protein (TIGR01451 family)